MQAKPATEAPITFPACQEGVNLQEEVGGGGGQTLGSMVTECVINAAMCPVPRTFATPQDPFSDSGREGGGQQEEGGGSGGGGGHPGLPYATTSVQRGDIVSAGGLGPMTLVSHEVMGDNRLVSDDGCVEGEGDSQPPYLH